MSDQNRIIRSVGDLRPGDVVAIDSDDERTVESVRALGGIVQVRWHERANVWTTTPDNAVTVIDA